MQDYLRAFANRHNIVKQLDATSVTVEAKKILPQDLEPTSFRSGILSVNVTSQAARSFYEEQKQDLKEKINKHLGQDKIEEIKFRINT